MTKYKFRAGDHRAYCDCSQGMQPRDLALPQVDVDRSRDGSFAWSVWNTVTLGSRVPSGCGSRCPVRGGIQSIGRVSAPKGTWADRGCLDSLLDFNDGVVAHDMLGYMFTACHDLCVHDKKLHDNKQTRSCGPGRGALNSQSPPSTPVHGSWPRRGASQHHSYAASCPCVHGSWPRGRAPCVRSRQAGAPASLADRLARAWPRLRAAPAHRSRAAAKCPSQPASLGRAIARVAPYCSGRCMCPHRVHVSLAPLGLHCARGIVSVAAGAACIAHASASWLHRHGRAPWLQGRVCRPLMARRAASSTRNSRRARIACARPATRAASPMAAAAPAPHGRIARGRGIARGPYKAAPVIVAASRGRAWFAGRGIAARQGRARGMVRGSHRVCIAFLHQAVSVCRARIAWRFAYRFVSAPRLHVARLHSSHVPHRSWP
ncbi:hypothetical protein NL676_007189 [Syzygium grande]|nr:hypothetical protein NL676_007189 [Syzygium grande]